MINDLHIQTSILTTSLFLVDLAFKGGMVLLMAGILVGLFRRASAAVRHRIWAVAMVSLLAMPVLMLVVPAWQVPLLPYPTLQASDHTRPDRAVAEVRSEGAVSVDAGASMPAGERREILPADPPPETTGAWAMLATLLWLGGTLVLLARLIFEFVQIWWITRLAKPITEAAWVHWSRHLAFQLLGSRTVRFVVSDRIPVPLTWGVRKPVILLPVAALAWPMAQQRAVLMHELTHIRRWDYPIHLLAQAGLALHWFNPLAWFAARRMLIEREKACDDRVLVAGTEPTAYAHCLLEVAKAMLHRKAALPGALSMARHSELESRVRSILDRSVRRSGGSRTGGILCWTMAACTLPFLAAMQVWNSPDETVEATPSATLSTPVQQAFIAAASPEAGTRARAACELGTREVRTAIPQLIDLLQDDARVAFMRCAYQERLAWNPAHYVWKEATVGEAAAIALAAIGGASVDALVDALAHNDATVRRNAAWALGEVRFHENQERAVGPLLERLADEDWWVRKTAAWALGEARSTKAMGGLITALNDPQWPVREQAARALGELADPAAEPALLAARADQQEPVRRMARWALIEIGSRAAN